MMKKCLSHDLYVFHKDLEMFFFFFYEFLTFFPLDYMMIHNGLQYLVSLFQGHHLH